MSSILFVFPYYILTKYNNYAVKALEDGEISVDGDIEKALVLSNVLKTATNKKASEIKKPVADKKAEVSKKTVTKRTTGKKK